jgi:hypothetical protein
MTPKPKVVAQLAAQLKANPQPPVTNPRDVTAVYANNVGISATMLDFTLYFIETGQLPGEKGAVAHNELKAAVTLPLPSAMALMEAVNNMLKNANEMVANQKAALQAMRKSSAPQ